MIYLELRPVGVYLILGMLCHKLMDGSKYPDTWLDLREWQRSVQVYISTFIAAEIAESQCYVCVYNRN